MRDVGGFWIKNPMSVSGLCVAKQFPSDPIPTEVQFGTQELAGWGEHSVGRGKQEPAVFAAVC